MAGSASSSGVPRMLRGSLVVQRRRCGKPNCRCAEGVNLHETPALSYSQNGRTRTVVLPASQVAAVQAAIDRYRAALAELEAAADAGIAALADRLSARRRGR
ncbi:MAG TPA: DUF6788 family protein [Gemmatimonadales bacterium]|nr:DUF6788 family protein [Gemmatimonadales bacterium]